MKIGQWQFSLLVFVVLLLLILFERYGYTKNARIIRATDRRVENVYCTYGKTTVLNFLSKPTKVLLGSHGLFSVEFVEEDIAIAPLTPTAHSNLFIYLGNHRYAFDLSTSKADGDEIVIVRDSSGKKISVPEGMLRVK